MRFIVRQLFYTCDAIAKSWELVRACGIVVSTDYSGIGRAEVAVALLLEALQHHSKLPAEKAASFAVIWRASEVESSRRKVLLSHPPQHRPRHIMGDILYRIGWRTKVVLRALLNKHLNKLKAKKTIHAATKVGGRRGAMKKRPAANSIRTTRTKSATPIAQHRRDLTQTHGRAFLEEAWVEIQKTPPLEKAHCFACNQGCQVHPPPEVRGTRLYINVSGNTCTPWSTMGSRMGWLHESSIVLLAWLWSLVESRPELIVNECTHRFDVEAFESLLSKWYVVQSCVYSPHHLGVPAKRHRRYTLCVRKDMVSASMPWALTSLEENFWRRMELTGRIFFRAPKRYLKRVFDKMAKYRGLSNSSSSEVLIAPGARRRKQGHILAGIEGGLSFVCMNISQSSEFYAKGYASSAVPTLTTHSSQIWGKDLGAGCGAGLDRLMVAYEKLAVHGWPVFLPPSHCLAGVLPGCFTFQNMLSSKCPFGEAQLDKFAGNGMRLAQVGLAVAFGVLCLSPSPPSSEGSA